MPGRLDSCIDILSQLVILTVSGLGTCVTDRYQDLRDTPLSAGGVDRDRAALSGRVGGPGRGAGDRGSRTVRRLKASRAPLDRLVPRSGPGRAGGQLEPSTRLAGADSARGGSGDLRTAP